MPSEIEKEFSKDRHPENTTDEILQHPSLAGKTPWPSPGSLTHKDSLNVGFAEKSALAIRVAALTFHLPLCPFRLNVLLSQII